MYVPHNCLVRAKYLAYTLNFHRISYSFILFYEMLILRNSLRAGLSSSKVDSSHKPPALNFSLIPSAGCDGNMDKTSMTSPTAPVMTSPESSLPTTPIVTSTKHLDKIDINSPTSTFGKKLAAFHNPGKLLPCKGKTDGLYSLSFI